MPTDIALLIASLTFIELGWYYSSAILAIIMFLYIYFSYRDLLAQRAHSLALNRLKEAVESEKDKGEK